MSGRPASTVRAWRPAVPGVTEVFHARFTDHAYPMHAHDSWTLLIVDSGTVTYDLERHPHLAASQVVTLLPPFVPHNGRSATPAGFRKRVVYLDGSQLGDQLIGRSVDEPVIVDELLRAWIARLHAALVVPGEEFAAEGRLALVGERLRGHLRTRAPVDPPAGGAVLAHRLRDLLDAHRTAGISLAAAAGVLHAHPAHLVRTFTSVFGMAPHRYLTSRRVDHARRLLLDGMPAREVATAVGFYDQSHLTRHFSRVVGVPPGAYARSDRTA
ncbi:AraC family transcriptional regulator [Pseudonocardia sp. CA-107938]|uniref:helix-turn-helix transcriptional regulator n=1 Tax=Pseudonocardia sp. CA-107938 TaxID=3240021 RepID=UPI003D8AF592